MRPGQASLLGRFSRISAARLRVMSDPRLALTAMRRCDAGVGHLVPVAQRRQHHVLRQRREARPARARQVAVGADHAVEGMAASDQALGADERPGAQVDLGLVPELEPLLGEKLLEVEPDGGGERDRGLGLTVEMGAGDRLAYGFRPERLLQRGAHDEPVPGADAAHVVEQVGVAAAHHLHDAAVALLAERAQHVDGVGAFERDVEEDDLGMAAFQRRDRLRRRVIALGLQPQIGERERDEPADAFLVVDDEGVGHGRNRLALLRRGHRLVARAITRWRRGDVLFGGVSSHGRLAARWDPTKTSPA